MRVYIHGNMLASHPLSLYYELTWKQDFGVSAQDLSFSLMYLCRLNMPNALNM